MQNAKAVWAIIGALLLLIVGVLVYKGVHHVAAPGTNDSNRTVTDGTITIPFSDSALGLATNSSQIAVQSSIPPCDPGFLYCLYSIGAQYAGTNFDSAGVRIEKRSDLPNERLCLETPPNGFDATFMPNATTSADAYSTSVFNSVGSSGAGHVANDSLYRLYYREKSSCYEFEPRVAYTQFANYPAGSIKEFSQNDASNLKGQLVDIVKNVTLPNNSKVIFP